MIYIIDKNTNRIVYRTDDGKPYLLDPHTYKVEADDFDLQGRRLWDYKWSHANAQFELPANGPVARKPLAVSPVPGQRGPAQPRVLPKI